MWNCTTKRAVWTETALGTRVLTVSLMVISVTEAQFRCAPSIVQNLGNYLAIFIKNLLKLSEPTVYPQVIDLLAVRSRRFLHTLPVPQWRCLGRMSLPLAPSSHRDILHLLSSHTFDKKCGRIRLREDDEADRSRAHRRVMHWADAQR